MNKHILHLYCWYAAVVEIRDFYTVGTHFLLSFFFSLRAHHNIKPFLVVS